MNLPLVPLFAALWSVCAAQSDNDSTAPIVLAPPPWTLKGTVYSATFVPLSKKLPTKAYSPLERGSAVQTEGEFLGGIGMVQIIRYTESPVGPYDELLLLPGFFKYDGPTGERTNVRITRIYVSQKYTCWNGRTNWNIPKHLARFDWTEKNGATTVKIYPHDTTGDPLESKPAEKPWFKATFTLDLLGGLPFTTDLYDILGVNTTLAQPPLPHAESKYHELAGTNHWAATVPGQATNKASIGIFDLDQGEGDVVEGQTTNVVGDEHYPNFWPGLLRFHPGMKLEDATITFSEPEIWG
ncbi:hypothetical protein B0I35DRAFT_356947 [Stachybotrys elegans]|uniref:Acetoacetate decarboxylase n=1 Tax=Stachybotrys elegans TaxID=80388 RepID=A0A8K0SIL9_9HYPO|nr:hypothetical protein B0I35DRAFT_356947 [Stachybotrys elegans]